MRFMMMIKATPEYEAGKPPSAPLLAEMGALMEQLTKAGVVEATEGLTPSAMGMRLAYAQGKRTVTDGPFAETKELVGGFAIVNANSREHAAELGTRILDIHVAAGVPEFEMEIRPLFDGDCASAHR